MIGHSSVYKLYQKYSVPNLFIKAFALTIVVCRLKRKDHKKDSFITKTNGRKLFSEFPHC